MKKIIKFFKRHMYVMGGMLYLGFAAASFLFVVSFVVKTINTSLPGGSGILIPEVSFDIENYKNIQDLVGIPVKEPEKPIISEQAEAQPPEVEPPTEEEQTKEEETTPQEVLETEPPQEPVVVLDKSSLKLSVFNGSGVTGAAAKLRSALETDGFKVLKVGNTETIQQSRLEIKESKKDFETLLRASIEKSYAIHEIKTLNEDNEADVIFIIGKE